MSSDIANPTPITAYIALGANLGAREQNLNAALEKLTASAGIELAKVASFFANAAVGGPADSPPFLNTTAQIATTLPAHELLALLLQFEQELGRVRTQRWGPRTIDLDLLFYGDQIINTPGLIVPHPLMHERLFVLQPLAQIAPDLVHPLLKKTIRQLLQTLKSAVPRTDQPLK